MDSTDVKKQGFHCEFINHPKKHGGGLAIIYRSSVKCQWVPRTQPSPPIMHGSWKLSRMNQTLDTELFYRPPGKDSISFFITEFTEYVERHKLTSGHPIFAGDFNVHYHDVTNLDALDFETMTQGLGLHQHIDCATHRKGHTLDLVFTPFLLHGTIISCTQGPYLSDHCMLILTLGMQKYSPTKVKISSHCIKGVDPSSFGPTLYGMLCQLDTAIPLDDLARKMELITETLLDVHAPSRTQHISLRIPKSWFNLDIKRQKHIARFWERQWRCHPTEHNWTIYREHHNAYFNHIKAAKHQSLTSIILDSKGDSRKLFNTIRKFTGSLASNPLPPGKELYLADSFSKFFLEKIQRIHSQFQDLPCFVPPINGDIPPLETFTTVSQDQVRRAIMSLHPKSCELDPLPA